MKASVYKSVDNVFLAILTDGRQVMRGDLRGLAEALNGYDVAHTDLLFGDWKPGFESLSRIEQEQMNVAMAFGPMAGNAA